MNWPSAGPPSAAASSALEHEIQSLLGQPSSRNSAVPSPPDFSSKMRKYYKLVLVVVTVISLVSFIFYKTQYDKLYNVLEVLEFFGPDPDGNGWVLVFFKNSI